MNKTRLGLFVGAVVTLIATAGCTTESYCFYDCEDVPDASASESGAGGGGAVDSGYDAFRPDGMPGGGGSGGGGGSAGNGETCDGFDNNGNGQIDEGFDFNTDPFNCGGCATNEYPERNCMVNTKGAEQAFCASGKCDYTKCTQDYWDVDGDRTNGCEYYCVKKSEDDLTCDNVDDNCDGRPDDGIDKCGDPTNCGKCGRNCQGKAHAIGQCMPQTSPPPAVCDETNTQCEIKSCDTGWIDANHVFNDGCEYQCTPTRRTNPTDPDSVVNCQLTEAGCGIEYCDGLDNDCNGLIDGADPNMLDATKGDPTVNKECFGATIGLCADATHRGLTRCVAATVRCMNDNTGTTVCTDDSQCTDPARPSCVDSANPPAKVCGTKVIKLNDLPELCNNVDDDCDGTVDDTPSDAGGNCGSNIGICSQGKYVCTNGSLSCSGQVDPQNEVCNGADDNCDGVIDGIAATPIVSCQNDSNCSAVANGKFCMVRNGPTDKVCAAPSLDIIDPNTQNPYPCDVPATPPTGWTTPCLPGGLVCQGGAKICVGSVKPTVTQDTCGVDANCDGLKTPDFDTNTDPSNCGSCGHDCSVNPGGHINWNCSGGACTLPSTNKCQAGYIDCDSDPNTCERSCTFKQAQETCDGTDDNCDCNTDEMQDGTHPNGIPSPTVTQVCDISPAASGVCVSGTTVSCTGGHWSCTYPTGHCTAGGPTPCFSTADICDGLDNNCNGNADESYKQPVLSQGYIGQACASDDGVTPKHGLCQQTGTYQCNSTTSTACMKNGVVIANVKLPCGTGAGQSGYPCDEACDGKDNDCDGVVDEVYTAKGGNATYWVKPRVVNAGGIYVFAYEASRYNATNVSSGTGNGWWRNASLGTNQPTPPTGVTLDKTMVCSEQYTDSGGTLRNRIPWFNISGPEAQHLCVEMGGRLCRNSEWQRGCRSTSNTCTWSFSSGCTTFSQTTTGPCNLGQYDFNTSVAGNQDGLLPTGNLATCYSEWGTQDGFDFTGNLRELTCGGTGTPSPLCTNTQDAFILMGGAFNTYDPAGAGSRCDFTFYNVNGTFKLYDVGFRCCFDSNPS